MADIQHITNVIVAIEEMVSAEKLEDNKVRSTFIKEMPSVIYFLVKLLLEELTDDQFKKGSSGNGNYSFKPAWISLNTVTLDCRMRLG